MNAEDKLRAAAVEFMEANGGDVIAIQGFEVQPVGRQDLKVSVYVTGSFPQDGPYWKRPE